MVWDGPNNYLRFSQAGTPTNTAELDASWTPKYSSIIGYWKLNGTAGIVTNGTSIPAAIGSGGSLITNGGVSYVAGKINQGLSFDGSGDMPDLGMNSALNTTSGVTVSTWINVATRLQNSHIVSNGGSYSDSGFSIFICDTCDGTSDNGNGFSAKILNSSTGQYAFFDKPIPSAGVWHHVLFSWNSSTNLAYFYLDGSLIDSTTFTGPLAPSLVNAAIGGYPLNGSQSGYDTFRGIIDDVAV